MNEGLQGTSPSVLHSALKTMLKIRGSLNVLQNLQKLSLPAHKRQGFWWQNANVLWVFPFLGRNLINFFFLMTRLTFNALVSMKSASPNSNYVWSLMIDLQTCSNWPYIFAPSWKFARLNRVANKRKQNHTQRFWWGKNIRCCRSWGMIPSFINMKPRRLEIRKALSKIRKPNWAEAIRAWKEIIFSCIS